MFWSLNCFFSFFIYIPLLSISNIFGNILFLWVFQASSLELWRLKKRTKLPKMESFFSMYVLVKNAACSIFQTTLSLLKLQIVFQLKPPQTCSTHLTTHFAFHAIFKPQKWPKLFQLGPDLICQIHVQTACSSTGYSLKLETYKSAPGSRCCFCYNWYYCANMYMIMCISL